MDLTWRIHSEHAMFTLTRCPTLSLTLEARVMNKGVLCKMAHGYCADEKLQSLTFIKTSLHHSFSAVLNGVTMPASVYKASGCTFMCLDFANIHTLDTKTIEQDRV